MPESPDKEKDVIQLKKEKLNLEAKVEALKKESYRLHLENDVLKKAAELLKKLRASVLKNSTIETRP